MKKLKRKTRKAVRKRFKITAGKKVLTSRTKRRHLLGDRNSSKKRQFRGWRTLGKVQARAIIKALPNG
ncbi:MAG: hypothetical protein A3G33_00895 [Omnitrophica bacterium RIFCSPLOWO2_12_FULL_44_17]|uniref:Large ribosomal subunit protein bL35 n=1 Tax=Candidatus Danuiimicrobium aquiferis TaxID=1801832 RepID=A0A1G1L2R6_9BACT|nr:MAG: hypothetical protein A3B72_06375 [Omnitrophica bacterium RIFCSPHIGHO2_02_FULL_45_28]OGW89792.1 MAG: hypothetical protein A3E74_07505 [Omnitrophica bacterium RIFCSPHIGHO2_12_FULL_44_12]OGW99436.1 MAG: hypothetical protein A3G33_00895 [Omnitrophica bacterium RIFCSPLOWO2_12_FULL_44_17]OGX03047.1 MAG: hypothetical protein A3J12_04880 [Omnitrophica bacterium RIFCSPLOWO2_02_FULL_44_11]